MTATDFLDRRSGDQQLGPASWGWRGGVRRLSGGLINPRMGRKELAFHADRQAIQKDFSGPRTIAFVNPEGGAAKTTGVLAAGYTFGTVRGGGVVAWDNNETRGTLGIRGLRGSHRNTTRELLEDLGRFKDVYQSRIGDLGAFVRSQGDAHFDVLASDERADVTGIIHASDFAEVHALLERFYRIILVDTGNNIRAENWLAAAAAADLLVVTSTIREDTGYSGLWMLDALQDAGHTDLKHKTITVLSDPSDRVDTRLAQDLVQVYEQRTRGVHRVPLRPRPRRRLRRALPPALRRHPPLLAARLRRDGPRAVGGRRGRGLGRRDSAAATRPPQARSPQIHQGMSTNLRLPRWVRRGRRRSTDIP
ncbi:hypothetical protein [Nocardioides sp. TF02-7]|uniref:MinD/ParA family ATP-binding protein n=1 Tax=Nocardioides sp. TF02-7 TaxID=2917724 RepID=UPI001F051312|nr:hypothetical protein [Nocardioides sp. TF02-7]UMG92633.1 hypothetical protein MF408_23170 [Nocardioides sp. TF02-7]